MMTPSFLLESGRISGMRRMSFTYSKLCFGTSSIRTRTIFYKETEVLEVMQWTKKIVDEYHLQ